MDSSSLERHLSSAEEAQLAEALELRRRQIDREIAEFKVEKEKEFRKFEKRLRSEKRDAERQKILQCEREVEKANFKRRGSKPRVDPQCRGATHQRQRGKDEGKNSQAEVWSNDKEGAQLVFEDTRSNGVRFAGATEIPQESETDQKSHKLKDGRSKDQQPFHEREVEFQGLFTPTYLPLLSGRQQGDLQGNVAQNGPSKTGTPPQASEPIHSSAPAASTGAPTPGSAPLTPANPRHSSFSDSRKLSMSESRSSSRSDISISSLRSSLRDPKRTRSIKRVLFSIDNVVVSPSTSPTMQRKIDALRKSDGIDIVSRLDASSIGNGREDEKFGSFAWRRDAASQSSKSALTNIPTSNGHSINSSSKPPMHTATQIGLGSTRLPMGGEGFEHIRSGEEDDELFAFDEDMRYQDKGPEDPKDAEQEFRGEELEELEDGQEELPTSSPHAGSLPIEIRWPPGRKDPRG